ncbi:MAG: hypothetical protein ACJA07_001514 [Rhodococcus sp. (in: high G+C Gram-positive bacteria)]|jgi:hypothetical protein
MRAQSEGVELTESNSEGFKVYTREWRWLEWTVAEHLAHESRSDADNIPLVVIGCGAAKAASPQRAADLYTGSYFKLALRAARAHVPDDRIRILSAKHGFLPLHRLVDPYDVRIGDSGSIAPSELKAQAKRCGLRDCGEVTVLAGRAYSDLARGVWAHARTPLKGTRGIGEQRHILARMAARGVA